MDPDWVIWKEFWSKISDGPWLGALEGLLVGAFEWTPAG